MFRTHLFLILLVSALLTAASAQESEAPKPSASASTSASAVADYATEGFIVVNQKTSYRFESDGKGTQHQQVTIRVQSEAGVQALSQLRLGYNSANQNISIDYVKVRKPDGSVVTADASAVQDMTAPVARVAPMYTDYREKHVTVPALRVGDTLDYQTTITTHTPLAAGQFWMEHDFRDEIIILDEQLTVDVPKSREVKLKTLPDFKTYNVREEGDRRIYTWNYKNLKTRSARENEARDRGEKRKKRPTDEPSSVQMTTFANWAELGKWFSGLEQQRRQPSEEMKAKALELTKEATSDRAKVQAIYDYVATTYRYISLSFGVGRFQPHAADEVFRNEYGDCKDKHNLLASMLQSLGYQMNTVLIHSQHKLDADIASPSQFDHVIGNLKIGNDVIWMDTTSEVAPMGMLVLPIRNKDALQISSNGKTEIVHTPSTIPFDSYTKFSLTGEVSDLGKLTAHISRTFRGDQDLSVRSAFRRVPRANWTELVTYFSEQEGLEGKITEVKASDVSDTAKPFNVEYDIAIPNFFDWSAKESRFYLPIEKYMLPRPDDDDIDPVKLGGPVTFSAKLQIKVPATITLNVPVPVSVKRDYAEYSSSAKFADHILTAERTLSIGVMELPQPRFSDLKSLVRIISADLEQQVRATSPGGDGLTAPKQAKTEELEEAAYNALRARKNKLAIELYKRVVEQDPKNLRAYNNMGRAYAALHQYDDAITAYKKAIELNAYDEWAFNNMGSVYEAQEKFDEAISYYRKQIEVNPLDQFAHGNLGRVLIHQHKYAEAVPELEQANGITPDNAFVLQQLGEAYLKNDQPDKALESFDKALEKSPTPVMWNNVAYSLAEKKQHLDKALQYAESAVSSTATLLRNLPPDQAELMGQGVSAELATYWDTLGWVYFQRGDMANAEKYIAASWQHAEHGEVAYHLGQIYEARNEKDKAIDIYARAICALHSVPEARERLVALVGAKQADKLVNEKRPILGQSRTQKLNWNAQEGKAEVLFTFDPAGSLKDIKILNGNDFASPHQSELKSLKFGLSFPDSATDGFVRRGLVSCTKATGCNTVLVPADSSNIDAPASVEP